MNAEQFIDAIADDAPHDDVERFSAELAKWVADQLIEGAYSITPEHAKEIARNYPGGWTEQRWIGGGSNALVAEIQITHPGRVGLTLRFANGEVLWRATLQAHGV